MRDDRHSTPARTLRLVLAAVGLLGAGTLLQARADPARFLTFIEVRSDASQRAQAILREYARTLRRGALPPRVVVLQEIDRSERFVVLESSERAEALAGLERRSRPLLQSLEPLLTAPPDRRAYRDVSAGCGDTAARSDSAATPRVQGDAVAKSRPLYVVAHLDIAGPMRPGPADALARLAEAACSGAGHGRLEVWQQVNRGNHFNVIGAWTSARDFDAFAASAAARTFRDTVGPWLGSPYDERLYRALDTE